MTKSNADRPDHSPEGHEWIADAYRRDVEPLGADATERVRQELAEERIPATLRTPFGDRHVIDVRMWDKEPVVQKVYPRFKDGWMKMRQELRRGPYIEGWVFIPVGAFKHALERPDRRLTTGAETHCQNWLEGLMSDGSEPVQNKFQYRAEAAEKFRVGHRAFDRAWANAISKTCNTNWSKPGRKS